jgi:hypothetical protein
MVSIAAESSGADSKHEKSTPYLLLNWRILFLAIKKE